MLALNTCNVVVNFNHKLTLSISGFNEDILLYLLFVTSPENPLSDVHILIYVMIPCKYRCNRISSCSTKTFLIVLIFLLFNIVLLISGDLLFLYFVVCMSVHTIIIKTRNLANDKLKLLVHHKMNSGIKKKKIKFGKILVPMVLDLCSSCLF